MRAILVLTALLATAAFGQQCAELRTNDFFNMQYSNCSLTTRGLSTGCFAVADRCLAAANAAGKPCDRTACIAQSIACTLTVTLVRNDANVSAECRAYGNDLYLAQVGAAAASDFTNTSLFAACRAAFCRGVNATLCAGDQAVAECTRAKLLTEAARTTLAPGQTNAPKAAIRVTIRISGAQWATVLNNPAKRAAAEVGIKNDLAGLLGVAARFIEIISITTGSLVVNFNVLEGNGRSPAALQTSVQTAATSSSWLASTQAVYTTVAPGESLTVAAVTVDATQAPTTLAPGETNVPVPGATTATSSAFGTAGVAVAAVAAVMALLA